MLINLGDICDIFDSVSDSDSLVTIVTILFVGLSFGKNDDISDIRDILIDDKISDSNRLRWLVIFW